MALLSATAGLIGPSIQVDPGFDYYKGRSPESVAREIEVNGYKIVRFIVTNDDDIDRNLVEAFHKRGIFVWYQTFGNGFYGGPSGLPKGWEDWKAGVLNVVGDPGYTWMSLSCPAYVKWKTERMAKTLKQVPFDGVEVVEPFQMGWDGPKTGLYGDLSHWAIESFTKQTGYDAAPEFKDSGNPRYFEKDVARYKKWVDFRTDEVSRFVGALAKASRKAAPGKPFAFWALANTSPDSNKNPAELAREWQGIDAVAMARASNPDLVCFQTNWPDWSNPNLPGSYPELYKPFYEPLMKAFPTLPYIVQADIGSNENMRRGREWISQFEKTCREVGCTGSTAYSYEIGLWMYTEKPEVRRIERLGNDILLTFQKRLDPKSASSVVNYQISPGVEVTGARWDGNLVTLSVAGLKKGEPYSLRVTGVSDDPTKWNFKGKPANLADQIVSFKG